MFELQQSIDHRATHRAINVNAIVLWFVLLLVGYPTSNGCPRTWCKKIGTLRRDLIPCLRVTCTCTINNKLCESSAEYWTL